LLFPGYLPLFQNELLLA